MTYIYSLEFQNFDNNIYWPLKTLLGFKSSPSGQLSQTVLPAKTNKSPYSTSQMCALGVQVFSTTRNNLRRNLQHWQPISTDQLHHPALDKVCFGIIKEFLEHLYRLKNVDMEHLHDKFCIIGPTECTFCWIYRIYRIKEWIFKVFVLQRFLDKLSPKHIL